MEKIKKIASYVKRSHMNHKLDTSVKMEIDVRWNTKLFMIESVYKSYNQIKELIKGNKSSSAVNLPNLTNMDIKNMKNIIEFMTPFHAATVELSARKTPTIHLVYLQFKKLQKHIFEFEAIYDEGDEEISWAEVKIAASENMIKKFLIQDLHKVAFFLHPNYKSLKGESDEEKSSIKSKCSQMYERLITEPVESETHQNIVSEMAFDVDDFMEFEFSAPVVARQTKSIKDEINAYSDLPLFEPVKDVLKFWNNDHQGKQFPKLRRLVQKLLGACASSVASESTFSTGGNIVEKKRTKLMGENEALTFIHYMLLMED